MSTPAPAAPPPKSSAKKWLLGCLVALLLLVLLGIAVLVLGVYAAKKQVDSMAGDASRIYAEAQRAADALKSAEQVAPTLSQAAEARMRLMRAASTVASAAADLKETPCPPDPARANLSVDAPWMAELVNGLPSAEVGTPWFRHQVFTTAAAVPLTAHSSEDAQMQALITLDHALGDAGSIAVIHTSRLVEPRLHEGGKSDGGQFEGFVQVVGYPDGETMCIAPFTASGTDQGDFEQRFWAAEEAAINK